MPAWTNKLNSKDILEAYESSLVACKPTMMFYDIEEFMEVWRIPDASYLVKMQKSEGKNYVWVLNNKALKRVNFG